MSPELRKKLEKLYEAMLNQEGIDKEIDMLVAWIDENFVSKQVIENKIIDLIEKFPHGSKDFYMYRWSLLVDFLSKEEEK